MKKSPVETRIELVPEPWKTAIVNVSDSMETAKMLICEHGTGTPTNGEIIEVAKMILREKFVPNNMFTGDKQHD